MPIHSANITLSRFGLLIVEAFEFETYGAYAIGTSGVLDPVFHPARDVATPIENREVFVDVIPGPSAEAFGHFQLIEMEFLAILETLTFGGGFSCGGDVVFAKDIFGVEAFDNCDFHFRHLFSPKRNSISLHEIFNDLVTGECDFDPNPDTGFVNAQLLRENPALLIP